MKLKDMPSFIKTTDPNDILLNFMGNEAQNCLKASTIIFNTFHDLEHEVLDAISSIFPRNIYTIGALSMILGRDLPESQLKSTRSSLWKEDSKCL
ncbi:hypothetical protein BVC80_9061g53 [Macleaya cordata]|uniref:UDP-glucuronosyl/UDP-glucosyltransferase n=1 Tax=Macleaya cordata TaxID=56857 RepID=A0A200PN35_MACCD|nr:hypothetical protein BVC80_9061g53 [Macleaya cordata]